MFAWLRKLARWCVTPTPRLFGNGDRASTRHTPPRLPVTPIAVRVSSPAALAVLGRRPSQRIVSKRMTGQVARPAARMRPRAVQAAPKVQPKPRRVWLEARPSAPVLALVPARFESPEPLAQAA
jgi:hypothetical protein